MTEKLHQKTLTRACLKESLHHQLNMPIETCNILLDSILKELTHLITNNDYVKIVGFGTFLIHEKKERMGRNPKTKVSAFISSRKSVSFRPSIHLRALVEKKK